MHASDENGGIIINSITKRTEIYLIRENDRKYKSSHIDSIINGAAIIFVLYDTCNVELLFAINKLQRVTIFNALVTMGVTDEPRGTGLKLLFLQIIYFYQLERADERVETINREPETIKRRKSRLRLGIERPKRRP